MLEMQQINFCISNNLLLQYNRCLERKLYIIKSFTVSITLSMITLLSGFNNISVRLCASVSDR